MGVRMATGTVAGGLLAGTPLAVAQQPDVVTLEEVIVSAQKRTEDLQTVPLSIVALGTEQLEQRNVQNFSDYVKLLPSVSMQGSANSSPGFMRVYMRGVVSGDNGNHSGSLPTVGTYLDEQPITTIQGALDLHIYDIARVEALAGPQGTLYGASSESGTLRIITNKPDPAGFAAGYNVEGNAISNGGTGGMVEGFVNLPVAAHAAVRLVGWSKRDAGYIDNVPGTRTYPIWGGTINNNAIARKDYNTADVSGARAALKIDLNDSWTVTPTVMHQRENTKGLFAYDPKVGDLKVTHFEPESTKDSWTQAALTVEGKLSNLDLVYAGAYMKRDDALNQDYTDYSFFYDQCCSYGAYVTNSSGAIINPSQYIVAKDRYTKFSHEFRLQSSGTGPLHWLAGVFVQRQTHGIAQRYKINGFDPALSPIGWPETIWLTQQLRVDRDSALFGELTYDISPKLSATTGVRYFKYRNSLKGFFGFGQNFGSTGENQCTPVPTVAVGINGAPCNNLNKEVSGSGSTPKLNFTWHIDDGRMVYVTYSRGFRPGGVNRRGTFPPYRPDYLDNYELGWKTSWADNRVRLNGALFYQKWKDFQFSFLGQNGLTNVTNAQGGARISGIETTVEWAATRNLRLAGSITLLDPKLTDAFCKLSDVQLGQPCVDSSGAPDPQDAAPKGTVLPITPKIKGSFDARYSFALGGFNNAAQVGYSFQGKRRSAMTDGDAAALGPLRSYGTVDLALELNRARNTVTLFLSNATDERGDVYNYAECVPSVCGAQTYIGTNQPRTWGVKFGQKF
jgi:outer membrane receptor protein involved in Fe transport